MGEPWFDGAIHVITTETSVRTDVTGVAGFKGFSACSIVSVLE